MSTDHAPTKISPDEVAERRDELFVLDVRAADDFEEWALAGSHNLPIYDELLDEEFDGLETGLDEIPADREVAVVCVAGITSARAATWLREHGDDARSMTDGMRGWGRLHRAFDVAGAPGVVQVVRPGTGCVSYVVHGRSEAVVVDPSQHVREYRGVAAARDLDIVGAVDTHAHADHVSGGRRLATELEVPYYLHEADAGDLDGYTSVEDGQSMPVGDRELRVLHTPGHTPGSVSLRFGGACLSGDTLFLRSVGRPDLEDADEGAVRDASEKLFESLDRLLDLHDDTLVLPGHVSDEPVGPVGDVVYALRRRNEMLDRVAAGERDAVVETIVESLGETPNNYQEIKRINVGKEPLTEDAARLELGPNNCAAN
jgi:glyoxylase-like metal-dependent hydrolase (beta-lactamase superfamily II)